MSLNSTEITGQIETITYTNPDNDYTVARINVDDEEDMVTAVGYLPSAEVGQVVTLKGKWVIHPKYGHQFEFNSYSYDVPTSKEGIQKYLSSGLVEGIGPVMSERIVDEFGKNALDVIDENPDRLLEVEGIGKKRYQEIKSSWEEQKEIRDIMVFLLSCGISPTYAARIFEKYGQEAVKKVERNPYRLARDIRGIGFKRVDEIAKNMGIEGDNPERIKAGISHVLDEAIDEGHVFLPKEEVEERAFQALQVEKNKVENVLNRMFKNDELEIETLSEKNLQAVYLPALYRAEKGIADKLSRLLHFPSQDISSSFSDMLKAVEKNSNIIISDEQRRAIKKSMREKVNVITGGPGTGKTTILKVMIAIFSRAGFKVRLAAPTGRAAKKMENSTGHPAETIHRLLDFNHHQGGFQKDEDDQIEGDIIIIDEASMLDSHLMYNLMNAVPEKSSLILVGDVNQLPPVGPGYVLRDILDSDVIPKSRLTKIYRQADESLIVLNSHRINSGYMPVMDSADDGSNLRDFYFVQEKEKNRILNMMLKIVTERIPGRFGFDPIDEVQVLSPMRRGVLGVDNLNEKLKEILNSGQDNDGKDLKSGNNVFHKGDKVMQIKNNYELEVFNGDIGRIHFVDRENRKLQVDYSGRKVTYSDKQLQELTLAYAITVHKSQGSEYPAMVMPVSTQHYVMLQRKLIYTALTRAENLAVMVGSKKALGMAVNNNKDEKRFSYLDGRLKNLLT